MKRQILFVVAILVLLYSLSMFFIGWHNLDLGWNFKTISIITDRDITDTGFDSITRTPKDLIIEGGNEMLVGYYLLFVSGILFGFVYPMED